ncbi:MAG: retropepsin-like domain-containing protein, partial [Candidatus Thiodiazotropha endolucinida]|nr:retropepsin-like domain-containing protein [Candidatus Thiodiazotropha taylori]MCW4346315.1 retropepsin-like domain-containing protein [Candidatus Thiodiazotropha endolucinida]
MLDGRSSAHNNEEIVCKANLIGNNTQSTLKSGEHSDFIHPSNGSNKHMDKNSCDLESIENTLKMGCPELTNGLKLENECHHISIGQVKTKTVKVPIEISGICCSAVVDTGAEVSVLNQEIYEKLPRDLRPKLEKAKRRLVVAKAGKEMSVCGMISIQLTVEGFSFLWPVYVAPIRDDFLLGWDIIYHHKFAIDPEKGLRVKEKWLALDVSQEKRNIACIEVKRAVTVPANCEFVVNCQTNEATQGEYLFEPVVLNRVIAAKAMVKPIQNSVPVRFINPSNTPRRIRKKTIVGYLQSPVEIQDTNFTLISSEMSDVPVPRIQTKSTITDETHS